MNAPHRRRRIVRAATLGLLVAVTALSISLIAPASQAAGPDCTPGSDWGTPRADLASQVVDLVNQHRRSIGLADVKVSPTLTDSAVWKARHMARYGYMQHSDPAPPVARSVGQRLAACGYPTNAGWGENIAYGYTSASAVMQGWLNSPGHRQNIESASYRALGVGAAVASNGRIYWAQNFGTVVDGGTSGGGGGGGGATVPGVTLTSGPSASTTSTSASFAWTTSGSPTSTTCSLDNGVAVACTSPRSYTGLAPGSHTFRVTVANTAGSRSASYTWTITAAGSGGGGGGTTALPSIAFTQTPSWGSRSGTVAWTVTGNPTSVRCRLDNGAPFACSSPTSFTVAPGYHSFRVEATNGAGTASRTLYWAAY